LRDGIKKTVEWFAANRDNLREVTFARSAEAADGRAGKAGD
jgi:hypothetical protein